MLYNVVETINGIQRRDNTYTVDELRKYLRRTSDAINRGTGIIGFDEIETHEIIIKRVVE